MEVTPSILLRGEEKKIFFINMENYDIWSSHAGSPMREGRCTTQCMVHCQKSGLRGVGQRECRWSPSYCSSVLVLRPCRSEIHLISNCWINTMFLVSICPVLFPAGCWHNGRKGTSCFEMAQTDWYLPSMLEKRQWTVFSQNLPDFGCWRQCRAEI